MDDGLTGMIFACQTKLYLRDGTDLYLLDFMDQLHGILQRDV